jgi:hypothetical protein
VVGRDGNSSKHPDLQSLVSNFRFAVAQRQMPAYLRIIAKDDGDLRRPELAIIAALVRPIVRKASLSSLWTAEARSPLRSSGRTSSNSIIGLIPRKSMAAATRCVIAATRILQRI